MVTITMLMTTNIAIKNTIISCPCITVKCTLSCVCYNYGYCYFMYLQHRDIDILTHQTLSFHVHILLLHRYCYMHDTIISCSCTTDTLIGYFTRYCYFIYLYHCYTNTLYTVISCSYITVTQTHLCTSVDFFCIPVTWIFLYSYYMIISCY